MLTDTEADLVLRSRPFKNLSRQSFGNIKSHFSRRGVIEIEEANVKLSRKKLIYVLNYGGRSTASGTTKLIATLSSSSGRNIIICDQSGRSDKELEGKPIQEFSGLSVVKIDNKLSLTNEKNAGILFSSSTFNSTIKSFLATYDQVFICPKDNEAIVGLMALKDFDYSIVLLAGLRRTRKADIKKIKANKPIDILFYD